MEMLHKVFKDIVGKFDVIPAFPTKK